MYPLRNNRSAICPRTGIGAPKVKRSLISVWVFRQSQEEVIVLHEFESALDHRVLKMVGRIERSDFDSEVLANAEVFRSPPDKLIRTDEACRHSINRLLTRLLCA
jgi:hypothetical protein